MVVMAGMLLLIRLMRLRSRFTLEGVVYRQVVLLFLLCCAYDRAGMNEHTIYRKCGRHYIYMKMVMIS